MTLKKNYLARLITKLSDAELAEKVRTITPEVCGDLGLIERLRDEAHYRESRKARLAG